MIKGIFFDLDGTIIESMNDHYKEWKKILLDYNIYLKKKIFF